MKTIYLSECGILPKTDITLALNRILRENTTDTEIVFDDADYYLSPNTEIQAEYHMCGVVDGKPHKIGVWWKGAKNCILRGNGARLLCSGRMQPIL